MKNYKPLPLPKDTAWERKSLSKYLPIWLNCFIESIRNTIKWLPVIWKDKHWDSWYIYEMLKKKLEFQREYLVKNNRNLGIPNDNFYITICLNLIERLQEDYYELEYLDDDFDSILYLERNKLLHKQTKIYLQKNQHRYCVPVTDKDLELRTIGQLKHRKAKKLLFKILEEKITGWWD